MCVPLVLHRIQLSGRQNQRNASTPEDPDCGVDETAGLVSWKRSELVQSGRILEKHIFH